MHVALDESVHPRPRIDPAALWELFLRALGGAVAFISLHFALRFAGKSLFRAWPRTDLDRWAPLAAAVFGLVFAFVWAWRGRRWNAEKTHFVLQYITRFAIAPIVLLYGVGKLQGGQFYPSFLSTLDSTINELNGPSLTWAYFGRSYPYAVFIGGGQILAALLLFSRRTQLLGAALVTVIFANVAVVNFAYDIGRVVLVMSTTILVAGLYLLAVDARKLKSVLWDTATPHPFRRGWVFVAIQVIVIAAWMVPDRVRSQGNIDQLLSPTVVHGLWDVTDLTKDGDTLPAQRLAGWSRIYFDDTYTAWTVKTEKDRQKRLGAVRGVEGFTILQYWVDPAGGIEMKVPAADAGRVPPAEFRGRYLLDGDVLRLTGTVDDRPIAITLRRAELRKMTRQSTP